VADPAAGGHGSSFSPAHKVVQNQDLFSTYHHLDEKADRIISVTDSLSFPAAKRSGAIPASSDSRPTLPIRSTLPPSSPLFCPPPPPAGEVIDLLSSEDELPSVIIPTKRKLKEKEQAKVLESSPGNKKRKSRDNAGPLDLSNIQVLDLAQLEAVPRSGLTPPRARGGSRGPRIVAEVLDEIVVSPSPWPTKNTGEPPTEGKEPVYFNSDFDDSLLDKADTAATRNSALLVISDSDDDDDLDMRLGTAKQESTRAQKTAANPALPLSARTLEILAAFKPDSDDSDLEIDNHPPPTKKRQPAAKRITTTTKASAPASRAASTNPAATAAAAPKHRGLSEEEKARRTAEKAKKENAAQAKREAKEAAAAEKRREQELASFNKLRTSKKDSAHEMIVDISTALARDDVGTRLVGFLNDLGSEPRPTWQLTRIERDWKVVKWRRKVKAEYSTAHSMFVPLPQEEIRDEKHVLVHLTAKEFVELAYPEDEDALLNLDTHVGIMKKLVPGTDAKVIYMIDGLAAYARKSKLAKNNIFRKQVLSAMGGAPATAPPRAAPPARIIDEEMLEDALLKLQVKHSCLIQQTAGSIESAEWVSILTGDISTIPYKTSRMIFDTSFCTDVGQVKTGVGAMDTWSKMLQGIHRVTPAVANGITDRYPDTRSLIRAFDTRGEGALATVPLVATWNGAPSNRTVGMALSRRIFTVFTGRDVDCLDV